MTCTKGQRSMWNEYELITVSLYKIVNLAKDLHREPLIENSAEQ